MTLYDPGVGWRALAVFILVACASPAWARESDRMTMAMRLISSSRDRIAQRATQTEDIFELKVQLEGKNAQIEALREQVAALSPPATPNLSVSVNFGDALVGPGQLLAYVPVTLSAPTDHTVTFSWRTQNGIGAYQGAHYKASSGWVVFQPGEQRKLISVPLLRELTSGQTIRIVLTSTPSNPPLSRTNTFGTISGGGAAPSKPGSADAIALPARPRSKALSWSQDFANSSFCVTDSGFSPSGERCWQGRPSHGITQDGNKEVGIYASPDRFPFVTMTGLGANGKRFIQLERHPEGFSENGKPILHSWDRKPFVYSSAMIQGSKLPLIISEGSYVEARLRIDLVQGVWPAFWLMPANGAWPPEIDIFEGFWNADRLGKDSLTTTVHWRDPNGNHQQYGVDIPLATQIPGFDLREWHTYGVHIERDWLTYYIDDVPTVRTPNPTPRGMRWYPLFNITTGGLVGEPPANAMLPARMGLDWIKVWNWLPHPKQ